jgi:hypothetical protein
MTLPHRTVQRIRTVFLDPKPTYTIEEAAELAECDPDWLNDARNDHPGPTIPWEELANYLTEEHTILRIESALGDHAAIVLPPLVQSVETSLRLPRAYVAYLAAQAKERGWTLAELLTWELRVEIPHGKVRAMEQEHPGIYAAIRYPYTPRIDR